MAFDQKKKKKKFNSKTLKFIGRMVEGYEKNVQDLVGYNEVQRNAQQDLLREAAIRQNRTERINGSMIFVLARG